jgi:sterol desaturase/sphingolipid hydroxylase (fatty acid hydroxylase superfamily)
MLLGPAPGALNAYVVFAGIIAVIIHSNIGIKFGWLRYIITTPQFHHWHHGSQKEAIDRNYAAHLPIFDKIFGTFYLPGDEWPNRYGIRGEVMPRRVLQQQLYPFRRPEA